MTGELTKACLFKRGLLLGLLGSHAALDAACVVAFMERWIPGSRSACPRMTFSIFTVALVTRHITGVHENVSSLFQE